MDNQTSFPDNLSGGSLLGTVVAIALLRRRSFRRCRNFRYEILDKTISHQQRATMVWSAKWFDHKEDIFRRVKSREY